MRRDAVEQRLFFRILCFNPARQNLPTNTWLCGRRTELLTSTTTQASTPTHQLIELAYTALDAEQTEKDIGPGHIALPRPTGFSVEARTGPTARSIQTALQFNRRFAGRTV